jgi:hypothetical protein
MVRETTTFDVKAMVEGMKKARLKIQGSIESRTILVIAKGVEVFRAQRGESGLWTVEHVDNLFV